MARSAAVLLLLALAAGCVTADEEAGALPRLGKGRGLLRGAA